MADPSPAPHTVLDPAAAAPAEPHDDDAENKDHRPRDSKGWDGKLRVGKAALAGDGQDKGAESEAEVSEDEGPPPEQLAADEDLLEDVPEDEDDIDLVHFKISSIPALRLERFKKLRVRFVHPPAFCQPQLTTRARSVSASARTKSLPSRYPRNSLHYRR